MGINKKEFKTEWENKTLLEVKRYYNDTEESLAYSNDEVKEFAKKLIELDINSKYYIRDLKKCSDVIKDKTADIKYYTEILELLKPILDKKENEQISEDQYKKYMTDNSKNIDLLLSEVERIRKESIDNIEAEESSLIYKIFKAKGKEETIKLINESIDTSTKEIIIMLSDTVGNIKSCELDNQGNRGFDGEITGDKGNIEINTILAGGYNIQKLHLRTIVKRF